MSAENSSEHDNSSSDHDEKEDTVPTWEEPQLLPQEQWNMSARPKKDKSRAQQIFEEITLEGLVKAVGQDSVLTSCRNSILRLDKGHAAINYRQGLYFLEAKKRLEEDTCWMSWNQFCSTTGHTTMQADNAIRLFVTKYKLDANFGEDIELGMEKALEWCSKQMSAETEFLRLLKTPVCSYFLVYGD